MAKRVKMPLPETVELPYTERLTDLDGLAIQTVQRDDDGNIIWKGEGTTKEPETAPCDTVEMLKVIRRSVPRTILAEDDSLHFMELHLALRQQNGSGTVVLPGEVVAWLVRLLRRPVPVNAEAKAQGVKPQRYALHLWGTDEEWLWEQLGLRAFREAV